MATLEIVPELLRTRLPERPATGHKGTFGHLFVIAGSRGFTGAAKLTCEAAGRAGAGLVTAGVPRPLGDVVAAGLTETMSLLLPATTEESVALDAVEPALEFAADKTAVALGPGLSQHPGTREFVLEFVRQCPVPFVVDADGLNCLSSNTAVLNQKKAPCVLTPHPGEMARLTGLSTEEVQANREKTALDFARENKCTVVLKGNASIVADEAGETLVNPTGNSGLATGGTGDVLTGIVGGLLAQGMTCFNAATLGVYLHGLAGDLAAHAMTERALIASDVIAHLPAAWRALEGNE